MREKYEVSTHKVIQVIVLIDPWSLYSVDTISGYPLQLVSLLVLGENGDISVWLQIDDNW